MKQENLKILGGYEVDNYKYIVTKFYIVCILAPFEYEFNIQTIVESTTT